jgi:tetratricopeptide (TPR) repeat protein
LQVVQTATDPDAIPLIYRRIQALAMRDPRRGVALARCALDRVQASDLPAQAWAHYTLGWSLLYWERFDAARPQLQAAKATFMAQAAGLAVLRCRHALLLADLAQFARPNLEQEFATLAEELAEVTTLAASVGIDQARLLYVLGRPHDADAILDQIAPIVVRSEPFDRARFLRIRGAVANARSDYERASDLLTQAERSFAALHSRCEVAKCWVERGWVALRQEQLDAALEDYRRAERTFTQLDLPLQLAFCAKNIGLLYSRRGVYDMALQSLLTALEHFNALKRTRDIGGCQLNLGNIYFHTGRWEAALACYERAEAHYTTSGVIAERLTAQRNRGIIYRALGRYAEAHALLAAAEAQARAFDNQAEFAEIQSERAALLADQGQYDQALLCYQQACDLFAQVHNTLAIAICIMEQGWIVLRRGETDQAQLLFESVAPAMVQHPHYSWQIAYGRARCTEAYGAVEEALGYYRSAITTAAGLRLRLASEEISSSLYLQAAQLHADALRLATDHGAVEAALEIGEEQRALVLRRLLVAPVAPLPAEYAHQHDTLRVEIAALLEQGRAAEGASAALLDTALAAYSDLLLRARHSALPAPAALDPAEPAFTLTALRQHLNDAYGANWTVLSYTLSGERLLIGAITPEGAALERTPYDQRLQWLLVQATQRSYRRYTYLDLPYLQGQADRPWASLRELAERLLPQAVRNRLHPHHRLLIVPAGPLHTLPWAALRLEDGWLAERTIVQIAPALSVWQALAARLPRASAAALLVGCGSFGARAPALPSVGAELDAVAARWPGTYVQLRDAQATRSELLQRSASDELARYSLLHIASHARLLPARGLAAHLKLWDGNLLLPEIAGLRVGGALVVLSACDGAAADVLPGEEVLSLSWVFLAAGASSVLASLWPVDDGAAVRIMAEFYDALGQHRDAALALTLAQRQLIATYAENDPATTPPNWASFVLTGAGYLVR